MRNLGRVPSRNRLGRVTLTARSKACKIDAGFAGSWLVPLSEDKRASRIHNVAMLPEKTIRRLKTYAGAQGYVYQYYFVGQRPALADDPEAPATEFVFDVTSDRKSTYAVSVFLQESAVTEWAARHGRPLSEPERYAAAKLRLFRAFDELTDLKVEGRRLAIDSELLAESLAGLGVE